MYVPLSSSQKILTWTKSQSVPCFMELLCFHSLNIWTSILPAMEAEGDTTQHHLEQYTHRSRYHDQHLSHSFTSYLQLKSQARSSGDLQHSHRLLLLRREADQLGDSWYQRDFVRPIVRIETRRASSLEESWIQPSTSPINDAYQTSSSRIIFRRHKSKWQRTSEYGLRSIDLSLNMRRLLSQPFTSSTELEVVLAPLSP